MATQYAYTTTIAVTLGNRSQAYAAIADMCMHLNNLGINLISIVRNGDNTVTVTLDAPIRADHAGFWFLPVNPVVT